MSQPFDQVVKSLQKARQKYAEMIRLLGSGTQLRRTTIDGILWEAQKTADDLVDDLHASDAPAVWPGSPCPKCIGHMKVYSSRPRGGSQIQYLRCSRCRHRPENNKRVVPRRMIRGRGRRKGGINCA